MSPYGTLGGGGGAAAAHHVVFVFGGYDRCLTVGVADNPECVAVPTAVLEEGEDFLIVCGPSQGQQGQGGLASR